MKDKNFYFYLAAGTIAVITAIILLMRSVIFPKNIIKSLPGDAWPTRDAAQITDITLHHAASAKNATPEDFNRWHRTEKGWPRIGYHYVVDRSGTVFKTNPVEAFSYHNGYNNQRAIGVCLVGNNDQYPPTYAQVLSARRLIRNLKAKYPQIKNLRGHKELPGANTACPGAYNKMSDWREKTGLGGAIFTTNALMGGIAYNSSQADN